MESKIIIFIHIPRCGGTTIHSILSNNFKYYILLNHEYSNKKKEFSAKRIRILKYFFPFIQINSIGGHPARTYLNYDKVFKKALFYFTFIRDPLDRYMSHLNFARYKGIKVDDYINQNRMDNVLTIRFANNYDIKKAKSVAKNDFDFIGLQKHFDESLILLRDRLGDEDFNINYEKRNELKNIVKNPLEFSNFSDNQKKLILNKIRYDRELYKFIVNEVYRKYVLLYHGNLKNDVKEFKSSNTNYRFPEKGIMQKIFNKYQIRIQKIFFYLNKFYEF